MREKKKNTFNKFEESLIQHHTHSFINNQKKVINLFNSIKLLVLLYLTLSVLPKNHSSL
jgi:hypothetical protein